MANEPLLVDILRAAATALGHGADKRLNDVVAKLAAVPHQQNTPLGPTNDEQLVNGPFGWQFGQPGAFRIGRVIYSAPFVNFYRVKLDKCDGDIPCCALLTSSLSPMSVRETSPIPPFTNVLVFKSNVYHYGIILGVLPDRMQTNAVSYPDWIEQGGCSGFKRDQYYWGITSLCANQADVIDFSNNRPLDAVGLGEKGFLNDLGMGWLIGDKAAFFRTDEAAGLFLYYLNRLVRLAAYNYQFETAGSEITTRNDQGEYQHYEGSTPYPWEALGLFDPDGNPHREISDYDVQYTKPYGKYEPYEDNQWPFYRLERYEGYLGQAQMRQLLLPPDSADNNRLEYAYTPCVFREQLGMDGSWSVQSAHSLSLVKRILIRNPRRLFIAEDPKGSTEKNYKFASLNGNGDDHKVTAAPKLPDSAALPNLLTAAGVQEFAAHLFQWKGLHPFEYHKDFQLDDPDGESQLSDTQQKAPSFDDLASQRWLDMPVPKKWHVDHRYGDADYYETEAGLFVLPDGSVAIRDGYGSQILLSAGSIMSSAPGDIMRLPGRSSIDWCGDDHIVKAGQSIDITSAKKDVRIKAEQNVEFCAANGGKGRLLLENKATSIVHDVSGKVGEDLENVSGVILKAAHCQVVAMGREVYLRTGGGDIDPGNIIIDAAKGDADVHIVANKVETAVKNSIRDSFVEGEDAATVTVANTYTRYDALIGTEMRLDGMLVSSKNGAVFGGPVNIVNGSVAAQNAGDGRVAQLQGKALDSANQAIREIAKDEKKERDAAKGDYKQHVKIPYHDTGQIGNDDVQKDTQFSLRNEKQYGTEDFQLPEAHWQHTAAANGNGKPFEEQVVVYQSQQLMPFPGYETWQQDGSFLEVQDKLYNTEKGRDVTDRKTLEDATVEDWSPQSLKDNYVVIVME